MTIRNHGRGRTQSKPPSEVYCIQDYGWEHVRTSEKLIRQTIGTEHMHRVVANAIPLWVTVQWQRPSAADITAVLTTQNIRGDDSEPPWKRLVL